MEAVVEEKIAIKKIKLNGWVVYLEDLGYGQGKVIVESILGKTYSYYWGAMCSDLEGFISLMNADYFARNLIERSEMYEMDVKSTFKNIRKHIRTEIGLAWYQEMEFQKQMREVLNDFQRECEDYTNSHYFVDWFKTCFLNRLDTYLIENDYISEKFESSSGYWDEVWHFISEKPTMEYKSLKTLHKKLVKHLNK